MILHGRPKARGEVAATEKRLRIYMKKAPQLTESARLQVIAGAGLEPATPAL
jgi:hypothetical protein